MNIYIRCMDCGNFKVHEAASKDNHKCLTCEKTSELLNTALYKAYKKTNELIMQNCMVELTTPIFDNEQNRKIQQAAKQNFILNENTEIIYPSSAGTTISCSYFRVIPYHQLI